MKTNILPRCDRHDIYHRDLVGVLPFFSSSRPLSATTTHLEGLDYLQVPKDFVYVLDR